MRFETKSGISKEELTTGLCFMLGELVLTSHISHLKSK